MGNTQEAPLTVSTTLTQARRILARNFIPFQYASLLDTIVVTTPMRILLITHGLPPDSVGGVEQHVSGLAQALAAADHQVEIYARTSRTGVPGTHLQEDWHGCRVTRVIYRWEELGRLRDLYASELMETSLQSFLDEAASEGRRFDVAHVHHLTGLSTGSVNVLQAAGIPVVLTLHDYWLMCPRGQMWHRDGHACEAVEPATCAACLSPTFPDWLPPDTAPQLVAEIHEMARATLTAASRLVTPSARTIPFFERLGIPADRIHVVENGVDTEALRDLDPPPEQGPLRIGYLGTLIPSKGLDTLIAAQQALPPGIATLTIHGNSVPYHGDDGFLRRAFAGMQPSAAVRYHGPYETSDLPRLLAEIDVLVAPSLWHEAFGLTVREAMAAGRPVIVNRMGGLQDAVTEGIEGHIVEPGDVAQLSRTLAALAADRPTLRSMGSAARQRIRGFSEMAADLLEHYLALQKLDQSGAEA